MIESIDKPKHLHTHVHLCIVLTNADLREGKIYGGALKPPPSF